jgi:hypothetical protein
LHEGSAQQGLDIVRACIESRDEIAAHAPTPELADVLAIARSACFSG